MKILFHLTWTIFKCWQRSRYANCLQGTLFLRQHSHVLVLLGHITYETLIQMKYSAYEHNISAHEHNISRTISALINRVTVKSPRSATAHVCSDETSFRLMMEILLSRGILIPLNTECSSCRISCVYS